MPPPASSPDRSYQYRGSDVLVAHVEYSFQRRHLIAVASVFLNGRQDAFHRWITVFGVGMALIHVIASRQTPAGIQLAVAPARRRETGGIVGDRRPPSQRRPRRDTAGMAAVSVAACRPPPLPTSSWHRSGTTRDGCAWRLPRWKRGARTAPGYRPSLHWRSGARTQHVIDHLDHAVDRRMLQIVKSVPAMSPSVLHGDVGQRSSSATACCCSRCSASRCRCPPGSARGPQLVAVVGPGDHVVGQDPGQHRLVRLHDVHLPSGAWRTPPMNRWRCRARRGDRRLRADQRGAAVQFMALATMASIRVDGRPL